MKEIFILRMVGAEKDVAEVVREIFVLGMVGAEKDVAEVVREIFVVGIVGTVVVREMEKVNYTQHRTQIRLDYFESQIQSHIYARMSGQE